MWQNLEKTGLLVFLCLLVSLESTRAQDSYILDKGDGDKRLYAKGARRTINGRICYTGVHAHSESAGNTLSLERRRHVAMTWSRNTGVTRLYHNGSEVDNREQDRGTGMPLCWTDLIPTPAGRWVKSSSLTDRWTRCVCMGGYWRLQRLASSIRPWPVPCPAGDPQLVSKPVVGLSKLRSYGRMAVEQLSLTGKGRSGCVSIRQSSVLHC